MMHTCAGFHVFSLKCTNLFLLVAQKKNVVIYLLHISNCKKKSSFTFSFTNHFSRKLYY